MTPRSCDPVPDPLDLVTSHKHYNTMHFWTLQQLTFIQGLYTIPSKSRRLIEVFGALKLGKMSIALYCTSHNAEDMARLSLWNPVHTQL